LLGLLAACTSREPQEATPSSQPSLVIGLLPEQGIFRQLERFEPLARYLSQRIGRPIALKVLPRYGNIIANFQEGKMDGAFFGSFTYALAHRRLHLQVLARPELPDGTSTYHGLLLVRTDSGIRTVRDMQGKVFAFVDQATTAGYLFPLAYFRSHGIADYHAYFKETYFAGTHADVIADVLARRADAGAVKNTVYERFVADQPAAAEQLTILERSPPVPENGLAVRGDLEPAVIDGLREALLHMHEDPAGKGILEAFGAARFIPTTDADYEPVIRYAEQIGMDLSKYEYVNR
jgi:phosphonate transport system substrate-binding protein